MLRERYIPPPIAAIAGERIPGTIAATNGLPSPLRPVLPGVSLRLRVICFPGPESPGKFMKR